MSDSTPNVRTDLGDTRPESNKSKARSEGPSMLCKWTVHVDEFPPDCVEIDIPWGEDYHSPSYNVRLRNNLENCDFSNIYSEDLPIAIPEVMRRTVKSEADLLFEAFGFAIMGRNTRLLIEVSSKIKYSAEEIDIGALFPLHLAISYLDGGETCCSFLEVLLRRLFYLGAFPPYLYINDIGHTLLDGLMIAILKSHTACLPGVVDSRWNKAMAFTGSELDICGRWGADSPCVRTRVAQGDPQIPFTWKHKFCHTSIQTITHAIDILYHPEQIPSDIDSESGLFWKYCSACGKTLKMFPLHALVMTAFHLGQSGSEDEDLFGAIACLLCLIAHGCDKDRTADISVEALLGRDECSVCDHRPITPGDLALSISPLIEQKWREPLMIGCNMLIYILQSDIRRPSADFPRYLFFDDNSIPDEHEHGAEEGGEIVDEHRTIMKKTEVNIHRCVEYYYHRLPFGSNSELASLWAAVQTEILTYRRIQESDPWLSEHFNMKILLDNLTRGEGVRIGLTDNGLMRPICLCGRFTWDTCLLETEETVSASDFSNLHECDRVTYIQT